MNKINKLKQEIKMNKKECEELMKGCKEKMVEPDGSYLGKCRKGKLCRTCQSTRTALLNEKKEMLEFLMELKKEMKYDDASEAVFDKIETLKEEIKVLEE